MKGPADIVDSFRGLRVLVLGDVTLDRAVRGAPVFAADEDGAEVVRVDGRDHLAGGAARVALNALALGGDAELVAITGRDEAAEALLRELGAAGVTATTYPATSRRTPTASRVVAGDRTTVYVDAAAAALRPGQEAWLLAEVSRAWHDAGAVVVCDLGHGAVTPRLLAQLNELQQRSPRLLIVEAPDLGPYGQVRPVVVAPCRREDGCAHASPASSRRALEEQGEDALLQSGALLALLTHPAGGTVSFEGGRAARRIAGPRLSLESRGALLATLALALAAGAAPALAASVATAAGAAASEQSRPVCTAGRLRDRLLSQPAVMMMLEESPGRLNEPA
jgi:D-beta-D-heptose 7-phosphate kinase / D-beta-D-heptose 1-phosphate adenosyltransferase